MLFQAKYTHITAWVSVCTLVKKLPIQNAYFYANQAEKEGEREESKYVTNDSFAEESSVKQNKKHTHITFLVIVFKCICVHIGVTLQAYLYYLLWDVFTNGAVWKKAYAVNTLSLFSIRSMRRMRGVSIKTFFTDCLFAFVCISLEIERE